MGVRRSTCPEFVLLGGRMLLDSHHEDAVPQIIFQTDPPGQTECTEHVQNMNFPLRCLPFENIPPIRRRLGKDNDGFDDVIKASEQIISARESRCIHAQDHFD
jgi:hypothetical protein